MLPFLVLNLAALLGQAPSRAADLRPGEEPPTPARTADPGTRRKLTVADVVAIAERHNPRLQAAASASQGAQAGVVTARSYINPEVTLGGFGGQRALQNSSVPGMLTGFIVTQRLDLPHVRHARIKAAGLGVESAQYQAEETRREVFAGVKQAFYQVRRRMGEVELADGNVKLLEDLQRRIRVQVSVGEAARLELIRADAELATARVQLESSRLRLSAAWAALDAAAGTRLDRDLEIVAPLEPSGSLPSLDEARARVMRMHPAIAAAEAAERRANALLELERAQRTPQPTVWADMFRQPDAAQYRVGVSLPVPLWNQRKGPIAEAVAAQRQTAALAEMQRLEIQAALDRAYGQYEVASQQVAMFESGILREADAAVKASEAAFRFGERGIIEVLDAQRVLRGARLDYLNAQFDRESALIELEHLGVLERPRP